ncbi:MAG: gluconate 2-dehydrogenase subunit 3 family protein, partial [Solirubrobacteraceae bacterium]
MAEVLSDPRHLPKKGADSSPGPPPQLPRQRKGITPQMRGRYPDYDVLATVDHWDPLTRRVVLERVANVPEIRFFDEQETNTLRAFCDVVLAQDCDPRIPALEMVDAKLHAGKLDGFRHHDMPPDPQTWRRVAANLDQSARERGFSGGFQAAPEDVQHELVQHFSEGELDWDLPVSKAWGVVMRGLLSAFYSHPWAWNE